MNKKSSSLGKLKIAVIAILSVFMIAVVVLCVRKAERVQNENNIIGTWLQGNSEEVLTFQDTGSLIVNQDMPEVGISCGSAYYEFVDMNIIRVTQGENSVEFEIDVGKNQLTISYIEQGYLELIRK